MRRLPLPHPGVILQEEFLIPMGLTPAALAKALGLTRARVSEIVRGQRGITPDTALRLGRYLGTSAELWMNLQTRYDLEMARRQFRATIVPRAA